MGAACTSCHTSDSWKTQQSRPREDGVPAARQARRGRVREVPHEAAAAGRAEVRSLCRVPPGSRIAPPSSRTAAAATTRRASGGGTFDHATARGSRSPARTRRSTCAKCHKNATAARAGAARVVEFRGLSSACASCHTDVHKAELGKACEACHATASFTVASFRHPGGRSSSRASTRASPCAKVPRARAPAPGPDGVPVTAGRSRTCRPPARRATGRAPRQVGTACEHATASTAPKFAPAGFNHAHGGLHADGRHERVECRSATSPRPAPSRRARTAVRLKGLVDGVCVLPP